MEAGEVDVDDGLDDSFVDLLDATVVESKPNAARVITLLEERGWKGWTRIERVPADRLDTRPGATAQPADRRLRRPVR